MMDEYDSRTLRALSNSEHGEYFTKLMEQEEYRSNTAITTDYIKDINSSCMIVLSEKVFNTICKINTLSREKNEEIPFFLFGREEKQGILYFHLVEYADEDTKQKRASFRPLANGITKAMNKYLDDNDATKFLSDFGVKQNKFKRAVRCYGHTHPVIGGGDRFSFADLSCTVEHALINEYFSGNEMGSLDVLITPSGDVNFIKYESNELLEGFMKYQRVYVKMNDGRILRLPAYKNGNYQPYPLKGHSR